MRNAVPGPATLSRPRPGAPLDIPAERASLDSPTDNNPTPTKADPRASTSQSFATVRHAPNGVQAQSPHQPLQASRPAPAPPAPQQPQSEETPEAGVFEYILEPSFKSVSHHDQASDCADRRSSRGHLQMQRQSLISFGRCLTKQKTLYQACQRRLYVRYWRGWIRKSIRPVLYCCVAPVFCIAP